MKSVIKTDLDPISSYIIDSKIPYSLIINILTLFIIMIISLTHQKLTATYKIDQLTMFKNVILGSQDSQYILKLKTMDDIQSQLGFLQEFSNIENQLFQPSDLSKMTFNLYVNYKDPYDSDGNFKECLFPLNPKDKITKPFDEDDKASIRNFLYQVQNFQIIIEKIKILNKDLYHNWSLQVLYTPQKNYVHAIMNHDVYEEIDIRRDYVLFYMLLILSLLSFFITFRKHYINQNQEGKIFTIENQDKHIYRLIKQQKPWYKMRLKHQLLIIDSFFIIFVISYSFQFIVAIQGIFFQCQTKLFDYSLGFACFFACMSILKYFQYFKSIQNVSNILLKSLPQIFRFLAGFSPVFIGYGYLGTCLFWRLDCFSTLQQSLLTLLSLMLGDDILGTALLMNEESPMGIFFLISFLLIFIIGIHNVLISIICDKIQKLRNLESLQNDEQELQKLDQEVKDIFLKKQQKISALIDKFQNEFNQKIGDFNNQQQSDLKKTQMNNYHSLLQTIKKLQHQENL